MSRNISCRNRRKNKISLPALDNLKVDVGCAGPGYNAAHHGLKCYIGIDILDYGQEIVWDIENGLPLPDNSCVAIHCSHVVEHVEDMIGLMNEFWRVLKPQGEAHIICPHRTNESAYLVHHIRRLDKRTFEAFDFSWSPNDEWKKDYDILPWKIRELVVNDRKDMHFWASPKKEGGGGK